MRCAFSWRTIPAVSVPWHAGGDIACAVETHAAIRVIVGDVMGHGTAAAVTAAEVKRTFRELARHAEPPHVLAMRLDRFVASKPPARHAEEFVTAQLIFVPKDRHAEPEIVCCGHPPPLLLRGGRASFLDSIPAVPPLGLLDLAANRARTWPLGVRPGDEFLLYTDGVTDAHDELGLPYALDERAAALAGTGLDALTADLLRHAGGKLRDDATLVSLRFTDEPWTLSRPPRGRGSRTVSQNRDLRIWLSAHYR
jgi:serine phosphatase RsbU (regulator of sigma subunit)